MASKKQDELYGKVDPKTLEKVTDVYGNTLYIPKVKKGNGLIPLFKKNGTRVLYKIGKQFYSQMMLHPENIFTENTPPLSGDILEFGNENHAEIFNGINTSSKNTVHEVETMSGEHYNCKRNPDGDTDKRRSWIVVGQ